jgi:AcrR family transcriptional regulator
MARERSSLRREEILTATVQQIGVRGVSATRAADVAKALGISTGLIFYHFGSLDQLVAEAFAFAVDQDLSRLREVVASDATVRERMTRALVNYGPTAEAVEWRIWIDGWSQALRNEPLRATVVRFDDEWRDGLRMLLQEGKDAGTFDIDDPSIAASAITSLMDGLSVQAVVRGETPVMQLRRDAAARTVVQLLGMGGSDTAAMLAELRSAAPAPAS